MNQKQTSRLIRRLQRLRTAENEEKQILIDAMLQAIDTYEENQK